MLSMDDFDDFVYDVVLKDNTDRILSMTLSG